MTIAQALRDGAHRLGVAGIKNPRLEARLLLTSCKALAEREVPSARPVQEVRASTRWSLLRLAQNPLFSTVVWGHGNRYRNYYLIGRHLET